VGDGSLPPRPSPPLSPLPTEEVVVCSGLLLLLLLSPCRCVEVEKGREGGREVEGMLCVRRRSHEKWLGACCWCC
jgi:hypothetical protein